MPIVVQSGVTRIGASSRLVAFVLVVLACAATACGDDDRDYLDRAQVVVCLDPMLSQEEHRAFVSGFHDGEFGEVDAKRFVEHAPSKVFTFDWGGTPSDERARLVEALRARPEVGDVGEDTTVINLCS